MGDVGVKYIFESNDQLTNNIKNILKTLKHKDYNGEVEELYESFINDLYENIYTYKESKRILITLYYSLEIIKENLDNNNFIRKELFLEENLNNQYLAEEIMNGILISSRNEHEESKLKYYGYLLGNIMFKDDLDRDECNRLIKLSRQLTYCQIKLINMYVISQTIQIPILQREDYTKLGIRDYKLLGILQDTLDMIQKSILNGSGKLVLDVVQINPSKIKVQGVGTLLYNCMSLNKMPYDELEDMLELLSK
ncbi:hypothetical protein [Terrisporobacter mayombei]|uniref:Uncharacterized protein n=1 Tax=Terrisporobacter mayombei TaxID=1541 RepID=A0ABY9Q2D9_9FIRM|nr:hypothetical protein [Terrisporobacter mayombei]MCC3869315.1 hypothetical protein [Terrisporobacter mayombei]WMT82146.1 hypothetical protein TEMA_25040 [Terrisporobacter mayombei]